MSTLFKYLDAKGGLSMLSKSNLQFTNAMYLNDPFDCHPALIDFSKVPAEQCKVWSPKDIAEVKSNWFQNNRERTWICSLSKVCDSILMWSYYNNHKGICIGIDMDKAQPYLDRLWGDIMLGCLKLEVQYRKTIEKPDYFQQQEDFCSYQLCTKAKEWEHEQEVRLIWQSPWPSFMKPPNDTKNNKHIINDKEQRAYTPIGNECFNSVYLGVNIDKNDREDIINAAVKLNPDIKIYQMTINPDAFKLDVTNIKTEKL